LARIYPLVLAKTFNSHIATIIAAKVEELHLKFGIPNERVICCVTDNEPTNNRAADFMPYDWVGCVDHLIELTTGIAFDGPGVKGIMAKCRKIVGHFSSWTEGKKSRLLLWL